MKKYHKKFSSCLLRIYTHQRALLQPPMTYYNRDMPYPADMAIYQDFWKATTGQEKEAYKPYARMDREMLRRLMQGAFDFADAHPDAIVWCGEFGVIRCCPLAYRENFFRDVISLVQEHGQPYCVCTVTWECQGPTARLGAVPTSWPRPRSPPKAPATLFLSDNRYFRDTP